MGMPQASHRWTRAGVLALPEDGQRHELVDGELLVTPAPSYRHQAAVVALGRRLVSYVRAGRLGVMSQAPADVSLGEDEVLQPDLFVAPLVDGRAPRSWSEIRTLLLAVEVLSPGTARFDRQIKRRRYQAAGTTEYWIVDLDAGLIERWRPEDQRPEIVTQTLEWQPDPGTAALGIELEELWREIEEG